MALKSWKCDTCEQEFKVGEWDCQAGGHHQVAEKTYYAGAGFWRTYVSEEKMITMNDGRKRLTPARLVQFSKGMYRTRDPEDQYALDNERGLLTAAQWEEKFIAKDERLKMKERELKAREERITRQENDLLARTKAQTKGQSKEHQPATS